MRTVKLTKESTKDILENLLKRSPNNYGKFESTVAQILDKVKNEGDAALFAYTKEFDKADVTKETIRVTDAEIEEAYAQLWSISVSIMKNRSRTAGLQAQQMELCLDRK